MTRWTDDDKAFPAPAFDEPPRRLRIYLAIWYAATVLAFVSVIVWAVMISTQPVDANPLPKARVEPLRYTADWPTECRRWINLPRAHEHGGMIREWAERVTRYKQTGTCVRVTRRANSAALLVLELHELGHLCIAPDAVLGFHTSRRRLVRGAVSPVSGAVGMVCRRADLPDQRDLRFR